MVVDYHGPTKLRREFQRDAGGISQAIATSPAARKCSYTLRPASLWAGLQPALQPQSNKAAALAQSRLLYGLLNGWKSESLSLDGGFAAGKQVRDMPDQAVAGVAGGVGVGLAPPAVPAPPALPARSAARRPQIEMPWMGTQGCARANHTVECRSAASLRAVGRGSKTSILLCPPGGKQPRSSLKVAGGLHSHIYAAW